MSETYNCVKSVHLCLDTGTVTLHFFCGPPQEIDGVDEVGFAETVAVAGAVAHRGGTRIDFAEPMVAVVRGRKVQLGKGMRR